MPISILYLENESFIPVTEIDGNLGFSANPWSGSLTKRAEFRKLTTRRSILRVSLN